MLTKTAVAEIQDYLSDASNIKGGNASRVLIPASVDEIRKQIAEATLTKTSITISGARTGLAGGAVPFGGDVIAMHKLNKIISIEKTSDGGKAIVQPGVILDSFQKEADSRGLFYPPDPTEWSCQLGGTIATNASGSRSFKYGATRNYVEALTVVLADGDVLKLRRGEIFAGEDRAIELRTESGKTIRARVPSYDRANTRKNTSGYFTSKKPDAIDLFIGSEGTLGIIVEAELRLLKKPEGFLSGIVFFINEVDLLNFVAEARNLSFESRSSNASGESLFDAVLLEYFDDRSLELIREKSSNVPREMAGAIFFEQETTGASEEKLLAEWNALFEKHNASLDLSWFTTSESDLEKMREFRHSLPVAVNERNVRNKQRKISTDMSVPDENFKSMLRFYKKSLQESALDYVVFGHIGDNHLHVNILPKDESEAMRARNLYGRFIAQAIMLGGCVSAEHGVGKLKRDYLYAQFGERYINEMVEFKKAFDPQGILGRGNVFHEKFLR